MLQRHLLARWFIAGAGIPHHKIVLPKMAKTVAAS
jgi:hypothetical protein